MNRLQNAGQVSSLRNRARGQGRWLVVVACWGWTATGSACSSESESGDGPELAADVDGAMPGPSTPGTDPSPEDEGDAAEDTLPAESAAMGSEGLDPVAVENIGGEPSASGSGAGTPSVPSNGCGQATALASGEQSLDVAGVTRTYVLDIPEAYTGSTPYPLVFAFHGATTSGQFFRSMFYGNLLSTMGDEAIVVHPDALGAPTAWNNQADIPFFDALLTELSSSLCIDDARVFATGHSSGGFFTNALGCQRGDVLRAIAPVSAGGPFVFGGTSCSGSVAVWLAHAENDETVTFDNGEGSRDRWLDANACAETSAPISPEPCEEYSGCDEGAPVRWCVYQDGHNWPDFAPQGIWEFFSSL